MVITSLTLTAYAVEESFSRYQLIIDKHPFGEEPMEAGPVQVPISKSFAKNLRLSMLFENSDGKLRAGVVDKKSKKSFILSLGQPNEDGIELVEADIRASEAMLRKGSEVVLFKLEGGAMEAMSSSSAKSRRSSYAERRRSRLASSTAQKPETPRLTGEALKKHLQSVQMDAIRDGLPPLPLPLTKEMDDQLVSEGVLPPQ